MAGNGGPGGGLWSVMGVVEGLWGVLGIVGGLWGVMGVRGGGYRALRRE